MSLNTIKKGLDATVVITSKDRVSDLRNALKSCMAQQPSVEVIVVDDASTDGTSLMVVRDFPGVILVRHEEPTGLVVGRNEAARIAKGDVIISIDDDAEFSSEHVVTQTMADFEDEKIGAVAIPYIDVKKEDGEQQRSPFADQIFVADRFVGTAHAVRRELFLQLGGYREEFFHQGEEGDFCLRMLDAGWFVKCGTSDRINHFESPKRDTRRMDIFGRRNDVLSAWLCVPTIFLPVHLAAQGFNGLKFGWKTAKMKNTLIGVLHGYRSLFANFTKRKPVSIKTYLLARKLRKSGPIPIISSSVKMFTDR